MRSKKIIARTEIRGYNTVLTGDKEILSYDTEESKDTGVSEFKLPNKTACNKLILAQEYTVCFRFLKK